MNYFGSLIFDVLQECMEVLLDNHATKEELFSALFFAFISALVGNSLMGQNNGVNLISLYEKHTFFIISTFLRSVSRNIHTFVSENLIVRKIKLIY